MKDDRLADERLMYAAAGGNRDSMNRLVRRYAGPLLTFIQRMIGDRHRSEELFQDVFLAAWNSRRAYRYPRPFRSWLFGIAMNKCRADFRKQRRTPVMVEDCPAEVLVSGEPSPAETVIDAETATMVATAVARLPAAQRTVVVLRVYNGLSYREIAEITVRTASTVRSHMFHALTAIRKYLEPRMK